MLTPFRTFLALAAATAVASPSFAQAPIPLRVTGNFSQNVKHVDGIERPFFTGLSAASGVPLAVTYNPMDVLGIQAADALRHLRSGAFDVMSVQIGMVARDDPFFEGLDLIGVSTNMDDLRKAVDAYREAFDRRLQERFGAKVVTLWPFGPQIIYCAAPIRSVDDLRGQKVRSFTPTMSALLQHLGATPVTLQFSEVYSALQRGVATCAITSATSGNTGNWPEVTTHILPLGLSGSVQGHFITLAAWRRFSPEQQAALTREFKRMEDQMWELAANANGDALSCSTGGDCRDHKRFTNTLVTVSAADQQKVNAAVSAVILPSWRDTCNRVWNQCTQVWNSTVGAARGFTIN
ncbi:TRAP transporter substrate-binding protein [Elioraea rosea]|uniref:TRAP transporter substrate-binding protein n=1 Tax=Elioraea rosea TaxID=2492390 RepID=UPI0011823BF6|nr:TRAP transporter substrate-binding protein [Elioraea rosea]